MLIRHLKREKKAYEIMWWMSFGISLVGVGMTAATVYFETIKGMASYMLYPSFVVVLIGILLIMITGKKITETEMAIEEREERIEEWYEGTCNG